MDSNKNYGLVGYDKDNDVYDDLILDTKEKCLEIAEVFKSLILGDRLAILSTYGEPYDWFEIWDYNTNECVQVIDL